MHYRPEIDGLRAVAVIPVIFFHAGFPLFEGGFVGVDIFFVISGYLITSILIAELETHNFSIAHFYERRARRILPALFLVMLACLPLAWLWLPPRDMTDFSQSVMAVSAFSSNLFFWHSSGYFSTATELKPLLHTWSLAVEEQFYLFFPVFLMLTWRLGKRRVLAALIVVAALSLALAQWGSYAKPIATFYLLPTRGWELLCGSLVAFAASSGTAAPANGKTRQLVSLLGFSLILYCVISYNQQTPFPGIYAVLPTVGAALVILCATQGTALGKILGSKYLAGLGLVSYSAYLWHQPLFAFARHGRLEVPGKALLAALAALAFVLAYFSWKYVELPFRSRHTFQRRQIFTWSALGAAFFLSFGLLGQFSNGFALRMPQATRIEAVAFPDISNGWCFYAIDSMPMLTYGEEGLACWLGDKSAKKTALLFGDSFAGQYEPLWDRIGMAAHVRVHAVTTNWCYPSLNQEFTGPASSPALGQCLYNRNYLAAHISKYDMVILGGGWGGLLHENKMHGVLELIAWAAAHAKLVVLMPSPKIFDANVMTLYEKHLLQNTAFDIRKVSTRKDATTGQANALLAGVSRQYKNVVYIDRDALFNVDGLPSDLTRSGIPFSLDGGHISLYGSRQTADAFLQSEKYQELYSYIHPEWR